MLQRVDDLRSRKGSETRDVQGANFDAGLFPQIFRRRARRLDQTAHADDGAFGIS